MKIIIWRNENFDNSKTIRCLPYKGVSWWCVKVTHKKRLLKYINYYKKEGILKNVTIKEVELKDIKNNIFGLDYLMANAYVLGEIETPPTLEPFNPKIHFITWDEHPMIKMGMISKSTMCNYDTPSYIPVLSYQLLIK